MKLVLDSNVVISGLLNPDRNAGKLLTAWRAGHFLWLSTEEQFEELGVVLSRKYFAARLGGLDEIKQVLAEFHGQCSIQTLSYPLPSICRDPDDDWLPALYDEGAADLLISGDDDLLVLKEQYRVMTVAEFLRRL